MKITVKAKVGDKFTIRLDKFCLVDGHDDSIPYHARVIINGVFVGFISNDGWGGMSDFTVNDGCIGLCREFNEYGQGYALYPEEVDGKFATLIGNMPITIEDICDMLAYVETCKGCDAEKLSKDNGWSEKFLTVSGGEWTLHYDRKLDKK